VSRGIAWFSFILYGENKLHMDSYVISLNYRDAPTFPPWHGARSNCIKRFHKKSRFLTYQMTEIWSKQKMRGNIKTILPLHIGIWRGSNNKKPILILSL
jgi:hypothetical protein